MWGCVDFESMHMIMSCIRSYSATIECMYQQCQNFEFANKEFLKQSSLAMAMARARGKGGGAGSGGCEHMHICTLAH